MYVLRLLCCRDLSLSLGFVCSSPLVIFSAFIIDESTSVSGYFLCMNRSFKKGEREERERERERERVYILEMINLENTFIQGRLATMSSSVYLSLCPNFFSKRIPDTELALST